MKLGDASLGTTLRMKNVHPQAFLIMVHPNCGRCAQSGQSCRQITLTSHLLDSAETLPTRQ